MHWIYVLKCLDNIIYIGSTVNLYTQLKRHKNGTGSKITKELKPYKLIGLYKVDNCVQQLPEAIREIYEDGIVKVDKEFTFTEVEAIILMCMKKKKKWYDIYGGRYNINYRPKTNPVENITKFHRPVCECKLPADTNTYNEKKYWRCCKKNFWGDKLDRFLEEELDYTLAREACNFYKEFTEDETFEI